MSIKFYRSRLVWFGVAMAAVMIAVGFAMSDYFQSSISGRTSSDKKVKLVKADVDYQYIDTSRATLWDAINERFPISAYRVQLENIKSLTQNKIKNTDLVERITLERELILLENKSENLDQSYEEKVKLLVEVLQYLDKIKVEFTPVEYNSAQSALVHGQTELADILFSKVDAKYRVALGGPGLVLAANAVYLQGRIAEDMIDFPEAYQYYRQAVRHSPENIRYLLAAGNIADNIALYSKAVAYYEAALHNLRGQQGESSDEIRQLLIKLGKVYESKADNKKAREYYQQAVKFFETELGKTHPATISAKDNLDRVMRDQ